MRSLYSWMKSNPRSPQLEKACAQQQRPNAAKNQKKRKKYRRVNVKGLQHTRNPNIFKMFLNVYKNQRNKIEKIIVCFYSSK